MSALEKKITSNEDRISSTKRPRSDKCPSPSKRLPLTSSRVLHSRVLILRGLYQCVLHDSSVHRCWYWSLFLTFRGSNQRVLHDPMLLLIVKWPLKRSNSQYHHFSRKISDEEKGRQEANDFVCFNAKMSQLNTGGPSCEIIILRNKSRCEILTVCIGIITTAPKNKKYSQ